VANATTIGHLQLSFGLAPEYARLSSLGPSIVGIPTYPWTMGQRSQIRGFALSSAQPDRCRTTVPRAAKRSRTMLVWFGLSCRKGTPSNPKVSYLGLCSWIGLTLYLLEAWFHGTGNETVATAHNSGDRRVMCRIPNCRVTHWPGNASNRLHAVPTRIDAEYDDWCAPRGQSADRELPVDLHYLAERPAPRFRMEGLGAGLWTYLFLFNARRFKVTN
jgi:hypothetical protein